MRVISDVIFVLSTTLIFVRSLKLIATYTSNSLADWAIFLLYIFQSLPVALDLFIGIPKYSAWLSGFEDSMSNDAVCVIYDIYILSLFICLMYVSKKSRISNDFSFSRNIIGFTNWIPDFVLFGVILSPAIHVLVSGKISAFTSYNSFGERGLPSSFTELNSVLIILAILALIIWYFRSESNLPRLLLFAIFSFVIIWISGKRYSVITILFSYLYMNVVERRESGRRVNIKALLVLLGVAVILYSAFYITSIKIIANSNFESLYASFRIDFGRDDVVKFTIWKEYLLKEHILEYPLQTVISTIFMVVPRFLFPGKGYPHYRYLTAALYNTTVLEVHAGMTPSILEMMISNFRFWGMPLCILFLCWYCKKADKAKTSLQRYSYAMVLMGMLTQSLDAMIILFYLVLFYIITSKVKFTFGKTE